jgi:putative membrane protein
MVLLDIVVDPLAVQGERWFLGRIFYYPEGGVYFGVPLSNFAGWLLVALVILFSYGFLERRFFKNPPPQRFPILGPLFYWGILAFNLAITFWIREWRLGAVGLALHIIPFFVLSSLRRRRRAL